jgi:hypothetical protein
MNATTPASIATPAHPAAAWALQAQLEPIHIDCVAAIMLKILDGKCKMNPAEMDAVAAMYDVLLGRPGALLPADIHPLIGRARSAPDEALLEAVYERRVLAETMISRPVMKGFKAMLRAEGVIGHS